VGGLPHAPTDSPEEPEIPGVGEARVEKYCEAFLHIVKEAALPEAATAEHEA
jgi:hypothetical protein